MTLSKIQLTYVPSQYWNFSSSGFKLHSKEGSLPKDASFFLMWIPQTESGTDLDLEINKTFPKIPVSKLLSCNINLAFPMGQPKQDIKKNNKRVFNISSVYGKIIPLSRSVDLLFELKIFETQDYELPTYTESVKIWAFLTKFSFELLNRGSFLPSLEPNLDNYNKGQWRLILKSQNDHDRFDAIIKNTPWSALNLPINFLSEQKSNNTSSGYVTDGLWDPSYVFLNFMDKVGDYFIRSTLIEENFELVSYFYSASIQKEKDPEESVEWDYKFLKSICGKVTVYEIKKYSETIVPSIIKNWVQNSQGVVANAGFSFVIELNYPKNTTETWPLNFYIQPAYNDSKQFSLDQLFQEKVQAKISLEIILRALGTAAKIFPPIQRALEQSIPQKVDIEPNEVIQFLKHPKELLLQSGFTVILPDVFAKTGNQRLTTRFVVRSKDKKKGKKGSRSGGATPMFGADSILEYKFEASLEGAKLTDEEFLQLLESQDPLINWRGKWVLIDQQDIEDLRVAFHSNGDSKTVLKEQGELSYLDAIKKGLSGQVQLSEGGPKYEVVIEGDLIEIVNKLKSIKNFDSISVPYNFQGSLRPYQELGLTWLANMCALNFGVCLADDMGLGKTIQVIAYLLHRKVSNPDNPGSTLIVCPTSVLFNWYREIKKFAPALEVVFHHGSDRIKDAKGISEYTKPHRIILTTYGTLRNDIDLLATITFSGIVVDESQNIKNYSSKQSQAIYKLQSLYRVCLSGTPIENRLMELWTLFEFLNPSLLGTRSEFQNKFALSIERYQDQDAIEKLKLIISPFILRRVKGDKSIINDLPEKNEMKVYMDLSEAQIKIYEKLVETSLKEIESISNDLREKKGLILKLLMQLKQVCNHPYQYLHEEAPSFKNEQSLEDFTSQSKKLERLLEMTEEVVENGRKVLIFTQFKKMGDIIQKVLEVRHGFPVLFFHGAVPEKSRREIVDEFQSEAKNSAPILILSLKAGGTGLNLTQGTTVIHFDRWWNPAVENQATDRAYRIGQKQKVDVYKFITAGTIEEKIDSLLEEKRDLADKILVSSGESWISDMSIEKLKELVVLTK